MNGVRQKVPRPAVFLSGGIFALSICSFAIVPLLALYLSKELHTPAGRIGIVLSVLAVSNQGLQVFVGLAADRFGTRAILGAGIVCASAGYLGFASRPVFWAQLACAFALGIGRATLSLGGKVLLTEEAGDAQASALTLRSVAVNAGAALGPLVGGLLLARFTVALVGAVAVHALFWLALVRLVPPRPRGSAPPDRPPLRARFAVLLTNRPLIGLTAASVGFWFLYAQLTFTFPLYADDRFHLGGRVGLLFAVNAGLAVALQYAVVGMLTRRTDGWSATCLGCAVGGLAFAVLAAVPAGWSLLAFVVLFSLAELMVVPILDIVTAKITPDGAAGGTFGFASLGWAAGGLLGGALGGIAYQAARDAGRFEVFWAFNGLVGFCAAAGFLGLRMRFGRAVARA
ncbi:MFS transporter [Actinomadura sp. B10D3]|uniref:MFS transporter n=1 Tax=Actinomadura sp. B10D3 TaxID=3153557 RepID=UPI00325D3A6D